MLSFKSLTLSILALATLTSNGFCMTSSQPLSRENSNLPLLFFTPGSPVTDHQRPGQLSPHNLSSSSSRRRSSAWGSVVSSEGSDASTSRRPTIPDPELPSNIGLLSISKIRRDQAPNEDHWDINPLDNDTFFLGVFDGHGDGLCNHMGTRFEGVQAGAVARYTAQNICSTILAHATSGNLKDAIILGTQETDRAIAADPYFKDQGSTAVFSFIEAQRITIANLGDSRCVVYNQTGAVIFATQDHTLKNEYQRILNEGGVIEDRLSDTDDMPVVPRIGGILMASRCLGDCGYEGNRYYKDLFDAHDVHQINEYKKMFVGRKLSGISNVPDVTTLTRNDNHAFMVLASDGLFDIISNEELGARIVGKMVTEGKPAQQAAREIVIELTGGASPKDDLTIILLDLRNT